jgi:hypothetical protein
MGAVNAFIAGTVGLVLIVTPWLEPFHRYRTVRSILRTCGLAMVAMMLIDTGTVVETIAGHAQQAAGAFIERFLSGLEQVGPQRPPPTTQP